MNVNIHNMTLLQELGYAVHLAIRMMDEAYPDIEHGELPPLARQFDSFVGSLMSSQAYAYVAKHEAAAATAKDG